MDSTVSTNNIEEFAGRILKVNHAGENGAVHIYAGQLFFGRLTARSMVAELLDFKSHEERQHHDQSAAHLPIGWFWPRLLSPIVSASTEAVIWLGMLA